MKVRTKRKALIYPILALGTLIILTFVFIAFQSRLLVTSTSTSLPSLTDLIQLRQTNTVPIPKGDPSVNFWIRDHLAWHDAHRRNNSTRRIIFQTIGAGLGDHIKALVWAYGYAVLSRRLLVIDWTHPYPIESVLSPLAVDRFIYRSSLDSCGKSEGHGKSFEFKYGRGIPQYMFRLLARDDVHTVLLKTGPAQPPDVVRNILLGSPSRFGYRKEVPQFSWAARRTATRILLEPSAEIRRRLAAFNQAHVICAYNDGKCSGTGYYSVHARLGIGTGETHFARFSGLRGRLAAMASCFVDELEKKGVPKNGTVLVASDTAAWRQIFQKVTRTRMPHARVVYYDNIPQHFRAIDKQSAAGKNSFLDQHTEMILIGNAIRTFALRSGFPEVGFWRGYGRHYSVVDRSVCGK